MFAKIKDEARDTYISVLGFKDWRAMGRESTEGVADTCFVESL